ncbi:MAG: hypothetical protein KatS3mg111_3713 [Pirellulaceae bacterium]|nr:MAG: hypothetical protein KatS3mg111_3713 [Pirellulaceae bacterium]
MKDVLRNLMLMPETLNSAGYQVKETVDDTEVMIDGLGPDRALSLHTPWIVRGITPEQAGGKWEAICKALRAREAVVTVSKDALAGFSRQDAPLRLCRIFRNDLWDFEELRTADLVELDLRDRHTGLWGWPSELSHSRRRFGFFNALRSALDCHAAVGIAIPVPCRQEDVMRCLEGDVDFVTLVHDPTLDATRAGLVAAIRQTRIMIEEDTDRSVAIIVDARIEDPWEGLVCLALGANVHAIDAWLTPLLTASTAQVGSGMLAGITWGGDDDGSQAIEERLAEAEKQLRYFMQRCGARRLRDLQPTSLRALSETAARIAGVELLK